MTTVIKKSIISIRQQELFERKKKQIILLSAILIKARMRVKIAVNCGSSLASMCIKLGE